MQPFHLLPLIFRSLNDFTFFQVFSQGVSGAFLDMRGQGGESENAIMGGNGYFTVSPNCGGEHYRLDGTPRDDAWLRQLLAR